MSCQDVRRRWRGVEVSRLPQLFVVVVPTVDYKNTFSLGRFLGWCRFWTTFRLGWLRPPWPPEAQPVPARGRDIRRHHRLERSVERSPQGSNDHRILAHLSTAGPIPATVLARLIGERTRRVPVSSEAPRRHRQYLRAARGRRRPREDNARHRRRRVALAAPASRKSPRPLPAPAAVEEPG